MRLRHIKNSEEIINKNPYILSDPYQYKGKWNKLFNNENPIYIEIGMGKGKFIIENAYKYPHINFIGIEKYSSVMIRALKKLDIDNIPNLKLICIDALELNNIFDKEISLIYLNFSDPWPKDRHAKRRLTSNIFLNIYENVFIDKINIIQKTDNYNLFNYSKEQYLINNYEIESISYNKDNIPLDNITTEYEEKFLELDNYIYKIKALKK